MADNVLCIGRFLRVLAHPIFPTTLKPVQNDSGKKVAFLLFMHIISSLFVFIGVFAADQAISAEANTGNWVIVMTFVTLGFASLVALTVRGCQNKLKLQGKKTSSTTDPSLNLRIIFLWIFGLAVTIHVSINFAIYIECIGSFTLRSERVVLSFLSNVIMLLFLLVQTSFISYFRNSLFVHDSIVNIASIMILAANFALWFNTMVSNINVFDLSKNATVPQYSNESYCFRTSRIQRELSRKVTPYLLPPRLEFCILASSFIIAFWRWPVESDEETFDNEVARGERDEYQILSPHNRNDVKGPHIFIMVIALLINTPLSVAKILQAFVFSWKNESVFFVMHLGECFSAICSIVAIYVCSYILTKGFNCCWRPSKLTTNEYVLILASSGMVAYYMFGFLTALASPGPVKMLVFTRTVGMFESYLQTHFLIKIKRYSTIGRSSIVISSAGILLMITNLTYWFLTSYNPRTVATDLELELVERKSWLYIQNTLVPLFTFYRLFSGMMSYSIYSRFRPR